MHRSRSLPLIALFPVLLISAGSLLAQETIVIDAQAKTTPFPHYWEQMFGSGRAILSLRESYRDDLRAVKQVADFRYVRFHAIFHEELGVYNEDEHGNPVYNFSYVDQVYDGLLKNGVKPFVEVSFMPKKLAFNPDALHPFWYKQNVSPPKSMERWDDLVKHFVQHLVDRYGIDEVSTWYFEVWNEPNIDFWNGIPRQRSYFDLYAHTARDVKSVSTRLRVGRQPRRLHGFRSSSNSRRTIEYLSTLSRRMVMRTIRWRICLAPMMTSQWTSAFAGQLVRCMTKSNRQASRTFRSFCPNGMCRA